MKQNYPILGKIRLFLNLSKTYLFKVLLTEMKRNYLSLQHLNQSFILVKNPPT